jgi:GDPmannose 4,6-dehydratase
MSGSAPCRAAVLGANGQDGTYLCKLLGGQGRQVSAVGRQDELRHPEVAGPVSYVAQDLRDQRGLAALLRELRPDRIYHFAAVHQSAEGEGYEAVFEDMWSVNVVSVQTCLEYARAHPDCRVLYGSSGRIFGVPLPARVSEDTPHRGGELYAESKIAATRLIDYYRRTHGLNASAVHLFNHESRLRAETFFIPRLVEALRSALADRASSRLKTLDFYCDWGSAEEYMGIALQSLEVAPREDYVLASGRTLLARTLADTLFGSHGLDYRDFVETEDPPGRNEPYFVSVEKCKRLVGRAPVVTIEEVCEESLGVPVE